MFGVSVTSTVALILVPSIFSSTPLPPSLSAYHMETFASPSHASERLHLVFLCSFTCSVCHLPIKSKTHGSPWRNLTIIVRRVEEHLLTSLEGQCSPETSTSKSQWEQHLPFYVRIEVSLAIFSSLGSL